MDKFELLKKYKELLEEGIIEQEEFDKKKVELLGATEIEPERDPAEEQKLREELDKKEKLYNEVISTQYDDSLENMKKNIKKLESIGEYKDSAALLEKYKNNLEKKEESVYNACIAALNSRSAGIDQIDAIIKDLREMPFYKDSKLLIEKCHERKTEIKQQEKEKKYKETLELLKIKKFSSYKTAIDNLNALGEYKDSKELLNKAQAELAGIKKKIGSRIIKIGSVCIAVIAIIVVGFAVYNILKPDLYDEKDLESTRKDTIHELTYNVPDTWKKVKKDSDKLAHVYNKKHDGEVVAVMQISYSGEIDLTGDAKQKIAAAANTTLTRYSEEVIYKDNAAFRIRLYCDADKVNGEEEFFEYMKDEIDASAYKNPRKLIETKVENISYTGDTEAGTKITADEIDADCVETYDTGVNKGTKKVKPNIKLKEDVVLVAGKTSTVTLIIGESEYTLDVACTTESPEQYKAKCKSIDYKSQLREDNIGSFITISGKVLQDCGGGYFRISSDGDWDDVYMVYAKDSDMVEEDYVTVYGVTAGIYTYETVMGATQKVPSITAKYVDR